METKNGQETITTIKKNFVFEQIQNFIDDRMELRYNTVKLGLEFRKRGKDKYEDFLDRDSSTLFIELKEESGIKFSKTDYETYLNSNRIESFDPYKAYLDSLPEWDGTDYIKQLASYIDVEETKGYYFFVQLKKWFVRAIKCALEDNYFNKQILVFVGEEQNTGKTTFCRWLCPPALKEYYTEETAQGKDEYIQLASNFLVVYDELVKLYHSGLEDIKAILSKNVIKYRPPYAKREQRFSRRCSFIGNTNQVQFLTDETGSIRFLSFKLKSINFDYSKNLDINKIYAQAYHLYKYNNDYEMTKEEQNALQEYNKRFFVASTEHDFILDCIRKPNNEDYKTSQIIYQWQAGQILQFLQDNNTGVKLNPISLGKALKFLGFERKIVKTNNSPKYIFELCLNHSAVFIRDSLKLSILKKQ